jgi:hypothetical protein
MTMYVSKYPDQSNAMLKYIEMIRLVAKKGGDYVALDENVRYMRQLSPGNNLY